MTTYGRSRLSTSLLRQRDAVAVRVGLDEHIDARSELRFALVPRETVITEHNVLHVGEQLAEFGARLTRALSALHFRCGERTGCRLRLQCSDLRFIDGLVRI